ncbi:Cyanovirin-N [Auricularia subglabra TFB-10046 SS5]|nr:Cyanovirin-N [Auricularia subglabra TFB-10046 SS5]
MQFSRAFLGLGVLLVGVVADSGFGQRCTNIHLSGSGANLAIDAACLNQGGGNDWNQGFTLSSCIANNNGEFACKVGGNAMQSCSNCSPGGTVLTCTCVRNNGGTDIASFDLNTCIGNNDSVMTCSS